MIALDNMDENATKLEQSLIPILPINGEKDFSYATVDHVKRGIAGHDSYAWAKHIHVDKIMKDIMAELVQVLRSTVYREALHRFEDLSKGHVADPSTTDMRLVAPGRESHKKSTDTVINKRVRQRPTNMKPLTHYFSAQTSGALTTRKGRRPPRSRSPRRRNERRCDS